ncbi:hypothetical protein KD050_01180 [Psychrobacillus sp. INOP01]|uniref:hypothetical protein n=1 Tax=Psychrobacillus sp. INOP01 TaxID=2829187 RepID=UPI001BA980BE|nr:hypothetical protein [Psychrobacillus sp. INOP01]QUG41943.1 hypothetical protein KD050_01180 [Psychrobacillus sp. INOP01]
MNKERLFKFSCRNAYWYNGRIDSPVADVAYQQYRYIEGLRGNPPYGSELPWH